MPKRIQRKRTRGWRMPPGAIYVGRPSKWGNPFLLAFCSREDAVKMFRKEIAADIADSVSGLAILRSELRGHDLACWCPLDQPCHADVLLELANA